MRLCGHSLHAARSRVFLNGEELKGCCVVADEEAGYVECLVFDALGLPVTEGDALKTERTHGIVQIEIPEEGD